MTYVTFKQVPMLLTSLPNLENAGVGPFLIVIEPPSQSCDVLMKESAVWGVYLNTVYIVVLPFTYLFTREAPITVCLIFRSRLMAIL